MPRRPGWARRDLPLSTSSDLIHWSQATLVVTIADLLEKGPQGNWSYGYFSLLDPNSSDSSFRTISDTPDLF